MSIAVTYQSRATVVQTNAGFADPGDATVTYSGMDSSALLNVSSTPPVTKHAEYQKALSGGVASIDLTAVPINGEASVTQDFTGLKIQVAKFQNPSTNANAITVTFGAANPYLLGGAAFKWILQPGEEITYKGVSTSPAVAGGSKQIDLSGTLTQALNVLLIAG